MCFAVLAVVLSTTVRRIALLFTNAGTGLEIGTPWDLRFRPV